MEESCCAKRPKARKNANPLVHGIQQFLAQHRSLHNENAERDNDRQGSGLAVEAPAQPRENDLPKRYNIYDPLMLLSPNFENFSPAWSAFYSALPLADKQDLFANILDAFRQTGKRITHIAVNAPIQLNLGGANGETDNVMRSPTNLQPLYGDFGPENLLSDDARQPSRADFETALWVEASQLTGIRQVWAPRWTMFSRGNIREKARILGESQHNASPFPGVRREELGQDLGEVDVVDFFVGIGYFALPYLKRGVRRVFGWDINGWSIEGLRRGCEKNGIECEVFEIIDEADEGYLCHLAGMVADTLIRRPNLRCIAFRGDNKHAGSLLTSIQRAMAAEPLALNVKHCNLGLLPSSKCAYQQALTALTSPGGWLHIHENADIAKVEHKQDQVLEDLSRLLGQGGRDRFELICEHTEMVKTYAPGVGHFVFDIKMWPRI